MDVSEKLQQLRDEIQKKGRDKEWLSRRLTRMGKSVLQAFAVSLGVNAPAGANVKDLVPLLVGAIEVSEKILMLKKSWSTDSAAGLRACLKSFGFAVLKQIAGRLGVPGCAKKIDLEAALFNHLSAQAWCEMVRIVCLV